MKDLCIPGFCDVMEVHDTIKVRTIRTEIEEKLSRISESLRVEV